MTLSESASGLPPAADRPPFVFGSPVFSSVTSATESEGEDIRKPPPLPNQPSSVVQNVPTPEQKPFTPADKFDDGKACSALIFDVTSALKHISRHAHLNVLMI